MSTTMASVVAAGVAKTRLVKETSLKMASSGKKGKEGIVLMRSGVEARQAVPPLGVLFSFFYQAISTARGRSRRSGRIAS